MAAYFVGEALALGLASGPACMGACGPVVVPSLLTERPGFRSHAAYLSAFLGARFLGYLLFAVVAWELGTLASILRTPRMLWIGLVYMLLACVLLGYAYSAKRNCAQHHSASNLVNIGEVRALKAGIGGARNRGIAGAAVLGFLTGLNLCPPFVAAGLRAAELGSLTAALLFFAAFFLGTSVWFVPFVGLGCVVRSPAVITVARMAMALIGLCYLALGIAMVLGRKVYGY